MMPIHRLPLDILGSRLLLLPLFSDGGKICVWADSGMSILSGPSSFSVCLLLFLKISFRRALFLKLSNNYTGEAVPDIQSQLFDPSLLFLLRLPFAGHEDLLRKPLHSRRLVTCFHDFALLVRMCSGGRSRRRAEMSRYGCRYRYTLIYSLKEGV